MQNLFNIPWLSLLVFSLIIATSNVAMAEIKPQTLTYKKVGDLQIQANVFRPESAVKRPVVLWIHGGALMMGSKKGVPKQLTTLCERENFVLVSLDYRLAPEAKIPEIIEDLKDGMNWIRSAGPDLFGADPEKMVVAGASAGGYLAMMSGIATKTPPTAIVAYWGFGDIDGKWTTSPSEFYRKKMSLISKEDAYAALSKDVLTNTDNVKGRGRGNLFIYFKQNGLWAKEASGFDPETEPEKFIPLCPIKNLSPKYPPILMLHGTADTDVPYEKSVEMAEALKRLNRPYELITIEKGGHGLWGGDRKLIEKAFQRSTEYIREQLTKSDKP